MYLPGSFKYNAFQKRFPQISVAHRTTPHHTHHTAPHHTSLAAAVINSVPLCCQIALLVRQLYVIVASWIRG